MLLELLRVRSTTPSSFSASISIGARELDDESERGFAVDSHSDSDGGGRLLGDTGGAAAEEDEEEEEAEEEDALPPTRCFLRGEPSA